MRAAIYARVSTADQQTLPLQIHRLEEYAATRAWTITQQVEEQASGAKDSRPKRAEILKAARRRDIDVVIVWKLDRWGRSGGPGDDPQRTAGTGRGVREPHGGWTSPPPAGEPWPGSWGCSRTASGS
jgi:hypothetical protein